MWRLAGGYLKRVKVKEPGSFKKNNGHNGECWGFKKECQLTGKQAATTLEKCFLGKATLNQLRTVRKSLSYAYFLTSGRSQDNYAEVKDIWKTFDLKKCGKPKKRLLADRVLDIDELEIAFTKPWNKNCGMNLMKWSSGLLATWDLQVLGSRPGVDLNKKLKNSVSHTVEPKKGWCSTSLVAGRAKLHGQKRGTRPWKAYRVCLCKDGKHVSPTDLLEGIGADGNPFVEPKVCTECPVVAAELVLGQQSHLPEALLYRKWSTKSGGWTASSRGDLVELSNEFLRAQGVLKEGESLQGNSGRQCLGRWLKFLKVPYPVGFQIHGDLESIWSKHYEREARSGFRKAERTQSLEPKKCCEALRLLAKRFKRGPLQKKKFSKAEKLCLVVLKALGKEDEAREILEEDTDDEESD